MHFSFVNKFKIHLDVTYIVSSNNEPILEAIHRLNEL